MFPVGRDIVMLPTGYKDLICELLLLTLSDVKMRSKKGGEHFQKRQEALAFLESEWFEELCIAVDLDPLTTKTCMIRASRVRG